LTPEPRDSGLSTKRMSSQYRNMMFAKFRAVRRVIFGGYDVFYSDPDVIFLNDPMPFFVGDSDIEFQTELLFFDYGVGRGSSGVEFNAGFVWYKYSERTLEHFRNVTGEIILDEEGHHDQHAHQRSLTLTRKTKPGVAFRWPALGPQEYPDVKTIHSIRALDPVQFANGAIAHKTIRRQRYLDQIANGTHPITQHFNFLENGLNAKIRCMKQYGMWAFEGIKENNDGTKSLMCVDHPFARTDWSNKTGCKDEA